MQFDKPIRRLAPSVNVAPTQQDQNTFRFVFSNESVGRDGFVVLNRGIDHTSYDRNPVVLFAHDDKSPPIGRGGNIDTTRANCTIDITFVPRDILPFAGTVRDLVAGKWLRGISLSWMPVEHKRSSDPNIAAIFTKVDMLECSVVPLPALPSALLEAAGRGINLRPLRDWASRAIDDGAYRRSGVLTRGALEAIHAASRPRTRSQRAARAAELARGAAERNARCARALALQVAPRAAR